MAEIPVIGRYEIKRGLGRGAMGSVYLAFDPKMGREVAVKVLQKEFAQQPKHRERFDREARAIAALRHPNIVKLYDYGGSPEDHLYLVMEYVPGSHTGHICREHGAFPEAVLASLGIRLADALVEAHAAGIIHRDIKPENVFLDGGRVVLGDFGIVKAITDQNPFGPQAASPMTDVIGTPGFMAPEQLEGKPLDERTDIFAFGALLYYLGCRKLPFDADSPYELLQQFKERRPVLLNERRPELSATIGRLVQDCLEVNSRARPRDMREVRSRLGKVIEELGVTDPQDLIAGFVADPKEFRPRERGRVVQHMVGRLKVAVRDEDAILADELRARLAILDPDNSEAARVTGVTRLIRADQPSGRGRGAAWVLLATALALAMIGATWKLTERVGTRGRKASVPARATTALLRVSANDRTAVFANGRALGHTPDFTPAIVGSGPIALEFVHAKRGRLTTSATLAPGSTTTVVVDWRLKQVRVAPGEQTR